MFLYEHVRFLRKGQYQKTDAEIRELTRIYDAFFVKLAYKVVVYDDATHMHLEGRSEWFSSDDPSLEYTGKRNGGIYWSVLKYPLVENETYHLMKRISS